MRESHHAHRAAEELKKALRGTDMEGEPPTFLLVMCNGYFATAAGEGSLYLQFLRNKLFGHYCGTNVKARNPDDADYKRSRL